MKKEKMKNEKEKKIGTIYGFRSYLIKVKFNL